MDKRSVGRQPFRIAVLRFHDPEYRGEHGQEMFEKRAERLLFFAALEASVFFLEFLDPPRGINQLLLAGEEGVTG